MKNQMILCIHARDEKKKQKNTGWPENPRTVTILSWLYPRKKRLGWESGTDKAACRLHRMQRTDR